MLGKPLHINEISWGGPNQPMGGTHYVGQVTKVHEGESFMGTYRVTGIYRVEIEGGFVTIRVALAPVELSEEGLADDRYNTAITLTKTIVNPSIVIHYQVPNRPA